MGLDELPPLAVYRYAVYELPRPAPAEDAASQEARDQAVREWRHYTEWPFELEIEVERGDDPLHLYGRQARAWLTAWYQQFAV